MSVSSLLRHYGVSPNDPRARKTMLQVLEKHKLKHLLNSKYRNYTDNDVRAAVKTSLCISNVLDKINLSKHGSNFNTIRKIISRLELDTSHFDTKRARVLRHGRDYFTFEKIFCRDSKYSRGNLRNRALHYKILPHECNECGNEGAWRGKPIILELDHINGINNDNRIENLRFLCPNCHSQAEISET